MILRALRHLALAVLLAGLAAPAVARAGRPPATRSTGKRIVVFVGLPGSGKSTIAERMATRFGTKKRSTGDVIRNAIKARGLVYDQTTDRMVAEEFAKRPGEIGKQSALEVQADPGPVQIVEGFRSEADLDAFLAIHPDATVVSVEVGAARRYGRMLKRGRTGEDNVAYLRDRDRAEIRRGVRKVMGKADLRLRPGDDADALDRAIEKVLRTAARKRR
jgi:dephospho-CoA kinase